MHNNLRIGAPTVPNCAVDCGGQQEKEDGPNVKGAAIAKFRTVHAYGVQDLHGVRTPSFWNLVLMAVALVEKYVASFKVAACNFG